jgi:hypothetical protein
LALQKSEVSDYQWVRVADIKPDDMAFLSGKSGVEGLINLNRLV